MDVSLDANHGSRVSGQYYIGFLASIHARLRPFTYFEVGVEFGTSLQLAQCATIAVDPKFQCGVNVIGNKPVCHFYQQTSDTFFAENSPSRIFGCQIDLAFLDGLHWFEALLRDFINTERNCAPQSTIVLHDCVPPGFYMTSRNMGDAFNPQSAFPGMWAGDVWKLVPTLRKYRPDLSVTITDCAPTGLVLVSELDPGNQALRKHYTEIVAEFHDMDRDEYERYWADLQIVSANELELCH